MTKSIRKLFLSKKTRFSFILVLFSSSAFSQQPAIRFNHLTVKDGLAHNNINVIWRDYFGFLWFATDNGLQKYDGYNFLSFKANKNDSTTISNNVVYAILEDHKKRMWFGTDGGGLNLFNREKMTFTCFKNYPKDEADTWALRITSLAEDSTGEIWIGTFSGLYCFNPESKKFRIYKSDSKDKTSLPNNVIGGVFIDCNKNVVIGTDQGICIYDRAHDNFFNAGNNPKDLQFLGNTLGVNSFYNDGDSLMWYGTSNGKIYKYSYLTNKTEEKSRDFNVRSSAQYELYSFLRDRDKNLWISTYGSGLFRIDNQGNVAIYRSNLLDRNSIGSNQLVKMFGDNDNTVWLGTDNGVSYFNLDRQMFNAINYRNYFENNIDYSIVSVCRDKNKSWWAATTSKGLYKLDKNFNIDSSFLKLHGALLTGFRIVSLFTCSEGYLWIGTEKHIYRVNPENLSFKECILPESSSGVIDFFEDRNGILWIAPLVGPISVIDKNTLTISSYAFEDNGKKVLIDRTNGIFSDSKGIMWISTKQNGVYTWNPQTNSLKNYRHKNADRLSLSYNTTSQIFESSRNEVWIATIGGGINKYLQDRDAFQYFMEEEGLSNNNVYSIREDHKGYIWCSTGNGLSRISPDGKSILKFGINDGLPVADFTIGNAANLENGNLIFGSGNYFIVINPELISSAGDASKVIITGLKVYDRPVISGEILSDTIHVYLNYKDNYFNIEFVSPEFLHRDKIRYAYKMEELNTDWIECGPRRNASFSNLEGGDYVFLVRSAGADGIWNTPSKLYIHVKPQLIKTGWFRMLFAFLIAMLIVIIFRLRVGTLRRQKRILESAVELRTRQYKTEMERAERSEKFKEEFLANMSHEIRTPMNAVVGLTNLLLKTNLEEKQLKYLSAIKESSDNLLVIINDILDLSKIEAGKIELEDIPFNVRKIIRHIQDILSIKAHEKAIELNVSINDNIPEILFGDPTRLTQILMNLVSNAIKFTAKGNVSIRVNEKERQVSYSEIEFIIKDTGIGIPADKIAKVFDTFTQAESDTSRKYGGSGLGLSICKKLVQMQGGNIEVKSKSGEGSEFSFALKYRTGMPDKVIIQSAKQVNPEAFNNLKILLVEDNEFNQWVAIDTLHAFNSTILVELAGNGNEAVKMAEQNDYDVILMDVQMPVMDGYAATQLIRSNSVKSKSNVPIIAMTANATKSEVERCKIAGMNEYISKPFSPEDLFDRILKMKKNIEAE